MPISQLSDDECYARSTKEDADFMWEPVIAGLGGQVAGDEAFWLADVGGAQPEDPVKTAGPAAEES